MKLPDITPIFFSSDQEADPPPPSPPVRNENPKIETKQEFRPRFPLLDIPDQKREYWDIEELEKFFDSTDLPSGPIKLNAWSTIIDVRGFIESHIATLKNYNGNPHFRPHLDRLIEFKTLITKSN